MVKYCVEPENDSKVAKASASHLRIHFKHCREIGRAINGRGLANAQTYLNNVLQYKAAIPYTKYTGGIGRHAMGKLYNAPGDKVSYPQKATKAFLDLLKNVQSNAETKGLNVDNVTITTTNVNQAPKMRRRTYRAHGRINAYLSCPAHITIIAEEKNNEIAKEVEKDVTVKVTKKRAAQLRAVKVGGGI